MFTDFQLWKDVNMFMDFQGNMPGKHTLEPTGVSRSQIWNIPNLWFYTWVTGRWVPGTRVLGTDAIIISVIVDTLYSVPITPTTITLTYFYRTVAVGCYRGYRVARVLWSLGRTGSCGARGEGAKDLGLPSSGWLCYAKQCIYNTNNNHSYLL